MSLSRNGLVYAKSLPEVGQYFTMDNIMIKVVEPNVLLL